PAPTYPPREPGRTGRKKRAGRPRSQEGREGTRNFLMLREFEAVAFAALVLFATDVTGGRAADRGAPATPVETVTDVYHGVAVTDPYRWLEKGDDKRIRDWSAAQDNRTRAYLDALAVRRPIYDRLMKLTSEASPSYSGLYPVGDKIFATY